MSTSPIIIDSPAAMRADSARAKAGGKKVALVPTMGALHEGHLSLLDHAASRADRVVVSIFVNPIQFNNKDDLAAYPRTFESDSAKCAGRGAQVIYAPGARAMYPDGFQTKVSVAEMTKGLCGAFRPGHFDGVTTVVLKLFAAVTPDVAIFGEKDFQQLKVIERMSLDLDLGVEVVGRPTVREADGLAMSSRNQYLSPAEREKAGCIWRGLSAAVALAKGGEKSAAKLLAAAAAEIEKVAEAKIEYLELVDAASLEPLEVVDRPGRMAASVWLGPARLIDNVAITA